MDRLQIKASLDAIQAYVARIEVERGFSRQTALEKCLLLGEELGDLFKAVRRQTGMPAEDGAGTLRVADELADMLIHLCAIANRHGICLEEALRAREARTAPRGWQPAVTA